MTTPYLSQVELFPFNFAPKGWAQCNGQIMSIQQNTALFALLGTQFGGNGTTTFALPDLRGRAAVAFGQGQGLSNYNLGEVTGTQTVSLTIQNNALHSHNVIANPGTTGGTNVPSANVVLSTGIDTNGTMTAIYSSAAPTVAMAPVQPAGGGAPHNNLAPYLTLNYCIALVGIFPSRG
ncbi:MAG TPA: tail fiber protein [Acetobacteraceae bacterium]|jgi:microcystin-dependent protein|nr:tail fiber protein [Acetobacteraceae bacterium]